MGDNGADPVGFACSLCGHAQACKVEGLEGGPAEPLDARGIRAAMAVSDGQGRDAWQSLALARCPSCRRRDPAAVRTFWRRAYTSMVGGALGMAALTVVFFSMAGAGSAMWLYALGAVAVPVFVYMAFRSVWDELDTRVDFVPASIEADAPRKAA